jgi:hypothetical protein
LLLLLQTRRGVASALVHRPLLVRLPSHHLPRSHK